MTPIFTTGLVWARVRWVAAEGGCRSGAKHGASLDRHFVSLSVLAIR